MSRKNKGNAAFYLARNRTQGKETHINKVLKEMDEAGEKLLENERRLEEAARHKQDAKDTANLPRNKIEKEKEKGLETIQDGNS